MPTVLRIGHCRFHFYSDESRAAARPRPHTEGECKFWLEPIIALAGNRGVRPHELRQIERLVFEHQIMLRNAFHEYHNR